MPARPRFLPPALQLPMANKRCRVPKVLRRVSEDRARSLVETILSLLTQPPPPPEKCRCRGKGCLGCRGPPFLLRRDDGADYRELLNRCFCIVSPDAPELTDFFYSGDWTQRLIVRNTMELVMDRSHPFDNVLCMGYDKRKRFSLNGELLCDSAWNLLLTRIGESAMVFLLKCSSIFVPLPITNHYQVTGPSLLQQPHFLHKPVVTSSASKEQQALFTVDHVNSGCKWKRKRMKFDEKQERFAIPDLHHGEPLLVHHARGTISSVVRDKPPKDTPFNWNRWKEKQMKVTESNVSKNYFNTNSCKDSSYTLLPGNGEKLTPSGDSTSEFSPKSRKRGRLFSWQRRRRCKKANTLGDTLNSCSSTLGDMESSSSMLKSAINLHYKSSKQVRKITCGEVNQAAQLVNQCPSITAELNPLQEDVSHNEANDRENSVNLFHTSMTSTCFNCSMVQSLPKVTRRAEIRKRHMFYNSSSSSSIVPRDHILNRLKPNNAGAHALLQHIFEMSNGRLNSDLACCFHSNDGPAIKSGCLYHSLLKLLKTLIRNAHKCHHVEFLRRHCSVPNKCSSDNKRHKSKAVERKFMSKKLKGKRIGLQKSSEDPFLEAFCSSNTDVNEQKPVHKKNSVECDLQFDQSASYCRHEDVISFLWAATRNIVPVDLLGDSSTWRCLRRNISKFVRLRRFEKCCLQQCIHGLRTSRFSFLARIPNQRVCHCFNRDDSSTIKDSSEYNSDWLTLKCRLFYRWIYWFFSDMIVPMLGANFYITERESGRHEIFYYPKPVWSRLVARTTACLKEQIYRPVDHRTFEQIINHRPFGFSKVRFLPKEKGVRLLANLKAPSKAWLHVKPSSGHCVAKTGNKAVTHLKPGKCNRQAKLVHFRSVNSALHEMYAILKRIKIECPQMLGASVFDYNDIYQMLHQFLSRLKNGSTTMPKVFIVVSDVSKAFDSIDQDRLLDIMKDVLKKEEYHVRKYAQVICSKNPVRRLHFPVCLGESKDNDIVNSLSSFRSCSSHSVLIDQGVDRRIKKVDIHHLLREHVKSNILQLGPGFYLQNTGIAQGSLLSSLLCSFYYGHLERTIIFPFLGNIRDLSGSSPNDIKELDINGCTQTDRTYRHSSLLKQDETCADQSKPFDLEKEDGVSMREDNRLQDDDSGRDNDITVDFSPIPRYLLLRLIDDFIFMSTSKRQATSLFNRLCRGFREYNCFMNSEKFGLNFDVDNQPQPMPNRIYVGADGIPFIPWSGLLVNCHTLEVQADYTRYLGAHLRSTLTVNVHNKGEDLGEKLCNYMRPKCHPIFYDSNINSPAIVRLNAYQAFLLCAMKFHCYLCAIIPNTCHIGPMYRLKMIQKSFSYMHRLIKKRIYGMERRGLNIHPILKLKKVETVWLGLSAYIRVLRKKQSRHAKLLLLLKAELDSLGRMDCDPSHLKYAVDDSHSSSFWKIKY